MKKVAIALVLYMATFAMQAMPVLAEAQKVDLVPCVRWYNNFPSQPPGGGFVIFNNGAEDSHNLEVTISLKDVEPNTTYMVVLFVDNGWYVGQTPDTITTNGRGNANYHLNATLTKGTHILAIDVARPGTGQDVYETPGIHEGQGTVMTFY
jgi:hypothetical protein